VLRGFVLDEVPGHWEFVLEEYLVLQGFVLDELPEHLEFVLET
jgi:hypothetical protein